LLIENILSFSRKTRNNNSWVSINEVSDTAINLSLAKARHANINIFTDYSDSLPKANFNKSNLLQVFLNLITNAIEACEGKRGEIKIKSYLEQQAHDKNIVWEISDNGIGIKEEDKEKIFSEFFTNKNNGTGIGLNVCRTLLREKEADLKFNSVYGQGTTFKVIFKNGSKSNDE
jgi:two-component system NtrC family sensor kinase